RSLEEADAKRGFTCGEPPLDDYLKRYAWINHTAGIARCYVLDADSHNLAGYYTLSPRSIERDMLTASMTIRLPKYPLPVVCLGRFAVATSLQRRGYGTQLMRDALARSLHYSNSVGALGVYLDSKNEKSTAVYRSLGFVAL